MPDPLFKGRVLKDFFLTAGFSSPSQSGCTLGQMGGGTFLDKVLYGDRDIAQYKGARRREAPEGYGKSHM